MSKRAMFCFCILAFIGIVSGGAADYSKQLVEILQLVDEKKYPEAIKGYEQFLQTAPGHFHGPVRFEIATLHAATGNKDRALALMEQSIQSGFDDCLAVAQYAEWKAVKSDPRFNTLHAKIRVSEADLKELYWLKAEIEHVNHDTKMMITENMNRMDTSLTVIPQSEIPVRQTKSPGVLFNRELLKMMHGVQVYYVMESDKARIEHAGAMGVISGGTSTAQVMDSSRIANHAAEERKRAIQQRKFSPAPGAGTTPRSCVEWNK